MFLAFCGFRQTYHQEAIWSNIWSTWPSTRTPKSSKNPLKRLPKSIPKAIDNMMQVDMAFATLWERILVDLGSNLGGNLGPNSLQNLTNIDQRTKLKRHLKIAPEKVTRHGPVKSKPGGVGPLKSLNTDLPGTTLRISHSSRATRARWRIFIRNKSIYIYIYIYIYICIQCASASSPPCLGQDSKKPKTIQRPSSATIQQIQKNELKINDKSKTKWWINQESMKL